MDSDHLDRTRAEFEDGDLALAQQRMVQWTDGLDSSYKGSIAEEFYVEYRARTGAPIERHMKLDPANNLADAEVVFPDGMDVRGAEVAEVKATEIGLEGRDKAQIETVLDALKMNGVANLTDSAGEVHDATLMRLTFTNPKGAYGSRKTLADWLRNYPFLTGVRFRRIAIGTPRGAAQSRGHSPRLHGGLMFPRALAASFTTPFEGQERSGVEGQVDFLTAIGGTALVPHRPAVEVRFDREDLAGLDLDPGALRSVREDLSYGWDTPNAVWSIHVRRGLNIKLVHTNWTGRVSDLLAEIRTLPFWWMGTSPRTWSWGLAGAMVPYAGGPGFDDSHFGHGWVAAFKGEGHRNIVSARWLEYAPVRKLVAGDITMVHFYDEEVDDLSGLEQAKDGHPWFGIRGGPRDLGGFIAHKMAWDHKHLRNLYDPVAKELIVTVHGRDVDTSEMLDACAYRRYSLLEKPVENVAFVFFDEALARRHLHALWLRGARVPGDVWRTRATNRHRV